MSNVAETYIQAGIETTHGTAVAADRVILALAGVPAETPMQEPVMQSRASYMKNYDLVEVGRMVEDWPFEMPAISFDTLQWWLQLFAKGGVAATGAGPYTWIFDGAASADDLETATFEIADNVGAFQIPYAIAKTLEITGKGGTGPSLVSGKFGMMGQKLTSGHTMTPALVVPDLVGSYMAFKNTQLFIDDAPGGIGGTEMECTLEEFNIKIDNTPEVDFAGGNSGYYCGHARGERFMEFSATLNFNAATYAEFSSKFQNNSLRYLQLKNTGAGNRVFNTNLVTKMKTFEFNPDGATRRIAIMGQSMYDPTLGYDWQMEVINDIATL